MTESSRVLAGRARRSSYGSSGIKEDDQYLKIGRRVFAINKANIMPASHSQA
jgi:hypothetical protein